MSNDERRASDLKEGEFFREIGSDTVHQIDNHAEAIRWHGDTVLITCVDRCEIALDGDTVVEGMDFAPVSIKGEVTLANGRSTTFEIRHIAGGDLSWFQDGAPVETLGHTAELVTALRDKLHEDDLLVVPCS